MRHLISKMFRLPENNLSLKFKDMSDKAKSFQRLTEKSKELGISLNLPATIKELKELKDGMKQELPEELLEFYSLCNGFETYNYLFRVLPIKEILQYKHELNTSSFDFAEYMIYSDVWRISIKNREEYFISNENHESEEPVILSNSIFEFLERYLSGGGVFGLYDWFEEIKLQNKNS